MKLSDIAKKKTTIPEKNDNDINGDEYERLLSLSFIESMNHYLYGMYVCFQKLKGYEVLNGDEFLQEMKNIPKLYEKKDQKEFLNKNKKIGKFLYWYLHEL